MGQNGVSMVSLFSFSIPYFLWWQKFFPTDRGAFARENYCTLSSFHFPAKERESGGVGRQSWSELGVGQVLFFEWECPAEAVHRVIERGVPE